MNFFNQISNYLTSCSHKLIGIMYGYTSYIFAFIGTFFSLLIRIELNTTGLSLLRKMKMITLYNHWISAHGIIMIFLFIMPMAIGYYGNYFLPILLGASELSLPRMNGVSYSILLIAVFMFIFSNLFLSKPISSGWTIYPPLSTQDIDNLGISIDLSLLVIHLLGLSSTLGSMNFITTYKYYKHLGLTFLQSSIYNYSLLITSFLLIGSIPILGIAITGLLLDRNLSTHLFDSLGDPILYQHLFWFFGHPEVYVIILPIFGLLSLTLSSITHKEIFGREGMIYCLLAIGIIGYLVWSHHMFTIGLDIDSRSYFTIATSIISIPTSVKIFSYLSTWTTGRGFLGMNSLWSFLSFLLCLTLGGFSGLLLSSSSLDLILHDTYFVVGHFHTVLSLAASFGLLVSHYYFFPLIFTYNIFESSSFYHLSILFIGALFVFYPMHLSGLSGMARRIPEYSDDFSSFTVIGFHGSLLLLISIIILLRSLYTTFYHSPPILIT